MILLGVGLACFAAVLITQAFTARSVPDPVWKGQRLSKWIRADDKDTGHAVIALGTNAIPLLFQELQAQNGALSALAKFVSRWIDIPSDFARNRRYRAALYLQYLDTNAVPALLDAAFAGPMALTEPNKGNLSLEAAQTLCRGFSRMGEQIKSERLTVALNSPSPILRCNACLIFYFGTKPTPEQLARIAELSNDPDDSVRAAAMRALVFPQQNEAVAIPALLRGLQDRHPTVRSLAIGALANRGSNVVNVLPALRIAYKLEATRPRVTNDADFVIKGTNTPSARNVLDNLVWASRKIDPNAPLP